MALRELLSELQLLECSLLPDEYFAFALPHPDLEEWDALFRVYKDSLGANVDILVDNLDSAQSQYPSSACRFRVGVRSVPVWFEVELPRQYPTAGEEPLVYVRGGDLDRARQNSWQRIVTDKIQEAKEDDTIFFVQNLLTTFLLPLLREDAYFCLSSLSIQQATKEATNQKEVATEQGPVYHALFTSHHLVSPSKRRNLQKWSSELSLRGFAKIGYPGCIYCEGTRDDVLDFVARTKALQWLALRVRFVESLTLENMVSPAPKAFGRPSDLGLERWTEFEKVREVVECMRKAGRLRFVTDVGLGVSTMDSTS